MALGKGTLLSSKAVKKLLYEADWTSALQTAYTLGLILREEGWGFEEALDVMARWNNYNGKPLKEKALKKRLESAYQRTQDRPSRHWVELLSGEKVEEKFERYFENLLPGKMPLGELEGRKKQAEGKDPSYLKWTDWKKKTAQKTKDKELKDSAGSQS